MMAARGVVVSYETIRRWCDKFGKQYADGLRRRRARTGDKWHLDEVFLKINGVTHYLWRAVDQNGVVLDILVQPKRDRFAAIRFFRKLLRATRSKARVIVTDNSAVWGSTGTEHRREVAGNASDVGPDHRPRESGLVSGGGWDSRLRAVLLSHFLQEFRRPLRIGKGEILFRQPAVLSAHDAEQ